MATALPVDEDVVVLPDAMALFHAFLRAAAALCSAALAMHQDDAAAEHVVSRRGLSGLCNDLDAAVRQMLPVGPAVGTSTSTSIAAFTRACCKVGGDLIIHLERIACLHQPADAAAVDCCRFRALWPAANVEALGQRLYGLLRQFRELCPSQ